MNLKELIKNDFGIDLPIKGGTGNSIDNPIIIERTDFNDYISVEFDVLRYLGLIRKIEWKSTGQQLIFNNERNLDMIEIETKEITNQGTNTQIESYYFDITECFGHLPKSKD